jgi:aspartyl-tRNA(Asn)/glutamyl-tRNA(Gln) amidotransferase subunit A
MSPNPLQKPAIKNSNQVDLLVHLSAIGTAPPLSEQPSGIDGYVQDVMTVPASLAGLPALNIPAGLAADGWPVGVSLVGQWGTDELVLGVGESLEREIE